MSKVSASGHLVAHVEFADDKSVKNALQLNGTLLAPSGLSGSEVQVVRKVPQAAKAKQTNVAAPAVALTGALKTPTAGPRVWKRDYEAKEVKDEAPNPSAVAATSEPAK